MPESAGLRRASSGDYYDFLTLGEERLGLLLADVSGKGMAAALLGASLHAAVRASVRAKAQVAGEVIARASQLLYETEPSGAICDGLLRSLRPRQPGVSPMPTQATIRRCWCV